MSRHESVCDLAGPWGVPTKGFNNSRIKSSVDNHYNLMSYPYFQCFVHKRLWHGLQPLSPILLTVYKFIFIKISLLFHLLFFLYSICSCPYIYIHMSNHFKMYRFNNKLGFRSQNMMTYLCSDITKSLFHMISSHTHFSSPGPKHHAR